MLDEFICACIAEGMKPLKSFDLTNEVSAQYMRNRVCDLLLSSSVPSDINAILKATHFKPAESLVTVQRWLANESFWAQSEPLLARYFLRSILLDIMLLLFALTPMFCMARTVGPRERRQRLRYRELPETRDPLDWRDDCALNVAILDDWWLWETTHCEVRSNVYTRLCTFMAEWNDDAHVTSSELTSWITRYVP